MSKLAAAFGIVSIVILFFIVYPLLALTISVDTGVLKETIACKEAIKALTISLEAATTSTLILLLMGVPLAYILARAEFRGKKLV